MRFQRVDKVDTLSRGRKTTVYFVKLFSSAYWCTVENNFAKSKQRCGFLDESRTVLYTSVCHKCHTLHFFCFNSLEVDQVFRQSETAFICGFSTHFTIRTILKSPNLLLFRKNFHCIINTNFIQTIFALNNGFAVYPFSVSEIRHRNRSTAHCYRSL